MPQKIALITGVTGQDGSYLAELLLQKAYHVVGILRRSTAFERHNIKHLEGKVTFECADLGDLISLEAVVAKHRPDEVYNLAAQSVPADSWNHPLMTGDITGQGVVRMLEAVRKHSPRAQFYQGSSREIYGGVQQGLCDESTPLLANNPYGAAKVYAHIMVRVYRESYGMFACNGVSFNHESPRRGLHFVTRKITTAAACIKLGINDVILDESGLPLLRDGKVHLGNLDSQRDWGYAKEYVEAMWLMLQRDEPKDYVIATNTLHSVRDFCKIAFSHVGLNWEEHVISDSRFYRPTEIYPSRGNYSLAKHELGWQPRTTLEELIRIMVDADIARLSEKRHGVSQTLPGNIGG